MTSFVKEQGRKCMPCSINFSMTLQNEILSTETLVFLKQIIILKSFNFIFCCCISATPAILCPDIKTDASSDHEGEPHVNPSHNSTNFDLMALCSAPTWLGPERRKTRRRRSPLPPPSPLCAVSSHQFVQHQTNLYFIFC